MMSQCSTVGSLRSLSTGRPDASSFTATNRFCRMTTEPCGEQHYFRDNLKSLGSGGHILSPAHMLGMWLPVQNANRHR